MASRFTKGLFGNVDSGARRLVREVLRVYNGTKDAFPDVVKISERLLRKKCKFFIIASHQEPFPHYHIVHLCPWTGYQCKCYTIGPGFSNSRRFIKTNITESLTESDFTSEVQYHGSNGRLIHYLFSPIEFLVSFCGTECIPNAGILSNSNTNQVEMCGEEMQSSSDSSRNGNNKRINEHLGGSTSSLPPAKRFAKPEELEKFILSHITVPLNSITTSKFWNNSNFRFIQFGDKTMVNAVNSIRVRLNSWNIYDYLDFYTTMGQNSQWECLNGVISDYYYTIEESVKILEELVRYQCSNYNCNEEDTVQEFINQVYFVCEKIKPKRNALELIGPASSGKSYFVDCVSSFYINVGHIKNFNKNESFPLQSAYNRRINVWNEAQCEHSALDWVKLFLGGDPCPANIKYQDTMTISRTPVLITANQRLIPNTQPFEDRMFRWKWKSAPFLINYTKKPHPLSYPALLIKYDVIENKHDMYDFLSYL